MTLISGERLQCLCDISIITPDIVNFHQNIAFKTPLFITTFKEPELEEKVKILDRCISIFVYTHLLDNFLNLIHLSSRSFAHNYQTWQTFSLFFSDPSLITNLLSSRKLS